MLTELQTEKQATINFGEKNPAHFAIYLLLFADQIYPFVRKKAIQNFREKLLPQLY